MQANTIHHMLNSRNLWAPKVFHQVQSPKKFKVKLFNNKILWCFHQWENNKFTVFKLLSLNGINSNKILTSATWTNNIQCNNKKLTSALETNSSTIIISNHKWLTCQRMDNNIISQLQFTKIETQDSLTTRKFHNIKANTPVLYKHHIKHRGLKELLL